MNPNLNLPKKAVVFFALILVVCFQNTQPALAGSNWNLRAAASMIEYQDLVVDETRGKLYGADRSGSKIDVIDMTTLAVTSSYLLVNGAQPTGIALSPDGNELAVAQSALSQVRFINLTNGAMADLSSPLQGSSTKGYDVVYGRAGILYALSDRGIHIIDLTQNPHVEDTIQYLKDSSTEKFGAIASDKDTLFYVTGTCCSGYNSLHKIDVSAGLPTPEQLTYTVLSHSGYLKNIRLALIDDNTLLTSFGTVYETFNLTPKAKKISWMMPVINLPGRSFYVTMDDTSNPDRLYFLDNQSSHVLSWLGTGKDGKPGAVASTSDGNTLFVSSTAGMTKFAIGSTPPGTVIGPPTSGHHYLDMAIDLPRGRVYGTDTSGRIDVMDINSFAILNSYLLVAGALPIGIDLSPDGSELAVALNGLEAILFLNPETGEEIARTTPQVGMSVYYENRPFDVIYGRPGRLYSNSASESDYHVIDTTTHTWLAGGTDYFMNSVEFAITADHNYLYVNERTSGSSDNVKVFDIQTDVPTKIYQGPHGTVNAFRFAIDPDGTKIFTSGAQVWSGDMQSLLGTMEGGSGSLSSLIEFIVGQDVVVLSESLPSGDILRFINAVDYQELFRMSPSTGGTIYEMESTPDGSRLIINTSNGMTAIDTSRLRNPHVLSVTRASSNPISTPSVDFNINFSAAVTGVDTDAPFSDFALITTAFPNASITSVSGSGQTYTVTVTTGASSGDTNGAIRLDVIDDNSIIDIDDDVLGGVDLGDGNFTTGEVYDLFNVPTPISPIGSVLDTTPTYKWAKIAGATQYRYQLFLGAQAIYTKLVPASVCREGYCSNTPQTLLNPGTYKWKVTAMIGGVWDDYSAPLTFNIPVAKAGLWKSRGLEFYVTPGKAKVDDFAISIYVRGCGSYKITHTALTSIKNKSFSFGGSFYASGTFSSLTTANGLLGLKMFYLRGCGYVSGGPFSWFAKWRNGSQPATITLQDGNIPLMLIGPDLELPFKTFTVEPESR